MTFTEKQNLAIKQTFDFCNAHPSLLVYSQWRGHAIKIAQDYLIELNMSMRSVEVAWRNYKKKVEEIERKERKRLHNKKKSDRMKRLRVKKENKRA